MKQHDVIIIMDDILNYAFFVDDSDGGFEKIKHRTDGPAIIDKRNGNLEWWLYGCRILHTRLFCAELEFDEETTMFWLLKYGETLPCRCQNE